MRFFLITGDNDDPLTCLAISPDGSRCLAGSAGGRLFRYEMDCTSLEPMALPRRYEAIEAIGFSGAGPEAVMAARVAAGKADLLRILAAGTTQLVYPDAPHPLSALALSRDGSRGLLCAGGQMLRYYPDQTSYLPVETPEGVLLRAIAFRGDSLEALATGGSRTGGFLARYEPRPDAGRLVPLPAPPCGELVSAAWAPTGGAGLAGGQDGTLLALDAAFAVRQLEPMTGRAVHGLAFHPSGGWALAACGAAPGSSKGAQLARIELPSGRVTSVYEGPPGAGAFTAVAVTPDGQGAVAATEWGQLVAVAF